MWANKPANTCMWSVHIDSCLQFHSTPVHV